MDLLQLADFHAIATHGGFSAASRATGTPKASLSRRMRALESDLGVRLFERGPRALRLTDEGAALRARTEQALAEIADASDEIAGRAGCPRGRLRVSVPGLLAQRGFGAFAARFATTYPEVMLEVSVDDRFVDPIAESFDVVVRVSPPADSLLVGQRLYRDDFVVAAATGMPRPVASGDIVDAVVLAKRPNGEIWSYRSDNEVMTLKPRPTLRLASMVLIHDAVLCGAGVGILPASLAAPDIAAGRLEGWGTLLERTVEVWALYPSKRSRGAKVGAFVTMLGETYAKGLPAPVPTPTPELPQSERSLERLPPRDHRAAAPGEERT